MAGLLSTHERTISPRLNNSVENDTPSSLTNNGHKQSSKSTLDNERITMTIDVPYTDHCQLIGKCGKHVKALMMDTQCKIHFPDSNRNILLEKSNEVSITGCFADTERARQKIRVMLSLVYNFKIPQASHQLVIPSHSPAFVHLLESRFSVEISYRSQWTTVPNDVQSGTKIPHPNALLVSVRGQVWQTKNVIEATRSLLEHHFGRFAYQVVVHQTIDVDPKHQAFISNHVAPRSLSDVIYEATGAHISLPEGQLWSTSPARRRQLVKSSKPTFYAPRLSRQRLFSTLADVRLPRTNRTMITISGTLEGTLMARHYIMKLLPVVLSTELSSEESSLLHGMDCSALSSSFDVVIRLNRRPRHQLRHTLTVKTSEQNISSLFYVWQHLRSLRYQNVMGKIIMPPGTELNTLHTLESIMRNHNSCKYLAKSISNQRTVEETVSAANVPVGGSDKPFTDANMLKHLSTESMAASQTLSHEVATRDLHCASPLHRGAPTEGIEKQILYRNLEAHKLLSAFPEQRQNLHNWAYEIDPSMFENSEKTYTYGHQSLPDCYNFFNARHTKAFHCNDGISKKISPDYNSEIGVAIEDRLITTFFDEALSKLYSDEDDIDNKEMIKKYNMILNDYQD